MHGLIGLTQNDSTGLATGASKAQRGETSPCRVLRTIGVLPDAAVTCQQRGDPSFPTTLGTRPWDDEDRVWRMESFAPGWRLHPRRLHRGRARHAVGVRPTPARGATGRLPHASTRTRPGLATSPRLARRHRGDW